MAAAGKPEHDRRFDGMAVQHVLGGLDDTDGRVFRAHLVTCGHCRARVGELRAIAHDLADVERDEERARTARQLETKRRTEPAQRSSGPPRPRSLLGSQTTVFALLVGLIALSVWIFFLRGSITELEGQLEAALEASRTLEAGRAWEVEARPDLEVEVREDGDALVVVVDGLEDGMYLLEVSDADGEVVDDQEARPTDGRMFMLIRDLGDRGHGLVLLAQDDADAAPLVEASAGR